MGHLVLDCAPLKRQRRAALDAVASWLRAPMDAGQEAGPDDILTAAPPPMLQEAVDWWQAREEGQRGPDQHRQVLQRLLLCGQWPTGAPELQGLPPESAAAYTFPHHPTLRVCVEGSGTGQRVQRVQPKPGWKAVVRQAAVFCGHLFDLANSGVAAGIGIPGTPHVNSDWLATTEAARWVQSAVTGCTVSGDGAAGTVQRDAAD